ncbi:MAG: sulfur reduction protein DsrS [Gammaproteobacteria bacterium]|nr:sulfur reduction protein DsrS [Gammaproteobacteria bacterium]
MELSAEDNLRLNVLLAQKLKAVRIDESKMIVHALTDKGEAKVVLNPNCKDEKYLKEVKALFSTHVMGSPGGYPVFLKRWTRMGQARDESLQQLLLLGESEAVVAAVHAPGLTDELAERAWWVMPTADNARRMLEKEAVVQGRAGPVLADFLIEFLPFEEDPHVMIDSVRLVLQPGLIDEEEKQKLWLKAKTKRNLYVGFMHALPDDLPLETAVATSYDAVVEQLKTLIIAKNPYALMLNRILSERGQAFIQTTEIALKKPGNQQVVESLFSAIAVYFETIKLENFTADDIEIICTEAGCICETPEDEVLNAVLGVVPEMKEVIQAMLILSCLSVKLINPVFSQTDAIGTMMRKKIKHITDPINDQLHILAGK